jgi:tryptophanase
MDTVRLVEDVEKLGPDCFCENRVCFEPCGQPFSMKDYFEIGEICGKYGIPLVADISMADRQITLMRTRGLPGCIENCLGDY